MDAEQALHSALRPLRRRLVWACVLSELCRWATWGAGFLVAGLALRKLGLLALPAWAPWACLAAGVCLGLARAAAVRVSDFRAALRADLALGLRERLSSAVLLSERAGEPLVAALVADAVRSCQALAPRAVVPSLVPRGAWRLGAGALLAVLFLLLPQYYLGLSPAEVAARKEIVAQGERITRVAQKLRAKQEELKKKELAQLARRLEELGNRFATGRVGKKQALLQLAELTDELKRRQEELARQTSLADIARVAQALRGEVFDSEPLQRAAQAFARGHAQEATTELRALAEKWSAGKLSPAERERLARDLEKLAQALAQGQVSRQAARALRRAAEALRRGELSRAQRELEQAARAVGQCQGCCQALAAQKALANACAELAQAERAIARSGSGGQGEKQLACESPSSGEQEGGPSAERQGQEGAARPGPGGGTTNEQAGQGPEAQQGYADIYKKSTPRVSEYEALYAPRRAQYQAQTSRAPGQLRSGKASEGAPVLSPARAGRARVPYYEVLPEYQPAVEQALADEEIPPGYRAQIKEYFEGLRAAAEAAAQEQNDER